MFRCSYLGSAWEMRKRAATLRVVCGKEAGRQGGMGGISGRYFSDKKERARGACGEARFHEGIVRTHIQFHGELLGTAPPSSPDHIGN